MSIYIRWCLNLNRVTALNFLNLYTSLFQFLHKYILLVYL